MSDVVDRWDVIAEKLAEVARDCEAKHLRHGGEINAMRESIVNTKALVIRNREACIVGIGENGRNGRLGDVTKQVDDHEERIRTVEKLAIKMSVTAGVVAAVASALLSLVLQRIL